MRLKSDFLIAGVKVLTAYKDANILGCYAV